MNMTGAQKHVQKLLEFIKSVNSSESALYDKTKQHLIDIAETCNQIECIVSEILQTAKPRGFNPNVETSNKQYDELRDRVDKLEDQMQTHLIGTQSESSSPVNTQTDCVEPASMCEPDISDTEIQPVLPPKKKQHEYSELLSPKEARLITHLYAKTLQNGVNSNCSYSTVKLCYDLIWKWYNKRILIKHRKFKKPRYDTRDFCKYIYAIVICFGYHAEHHTLDIFIQKFEEWIDSIGKSREITENYVVPYEVYQIYKKERQKQCTFYSNLTAAVLWDIMWDNGYSDLEHIEAVPVASLRNDGVYNKIDDFEQDTLMDYLLYSEYPEILQRVSIV